MKKQTSISNDLITSDIVEKALKKLDLTDALVDALSEQAYKIAEVWIKENKEKIETAVKAKLTERFPRQLEQIVRDMHVYVDY